MTKPSESSESKGEEITKLVIGPSGRQRVVVGHRTLTTGPTQAVTALALVPKAIREDAFTFWPYELGGEG